MNNLITSDIKMTSLDIAKTIKKRHADLMRDIRIEIDNLGKKAQRIFTLGTYKDKNNQERPCYEFGKDGAMQLALKYDAKTRYAVIQYVNKLERDKTLIQEIEKNPEIINYLAEQIAKINTSNNKHHEETNQKLETIDHKIEGEYVSPQDIDAIKYAIKVKAEKFMDSMGLQLTMESIITDDIYEQAQISRMQKQQYRHDLGKVKSRILVETKKGLGMKGNAPNNHIKRKDVDLTIQIINDIKRHEIEI